MKNPDLYCCATCDIKLIKLIKLAFVRKGISKVNTMRHAQEDGEVVFSCSATGKPAPTIAWNLSDGATIADPQQTVTVKNSDHTFNTSSNITVKVPPGWSGHAACVLNRGKIGEREERIAFSSSASTDGDDHTGMHGSFYVTAIMYNTGVMLGNKIFLINDHALGVHSNHLIQA